MDLEQNYHFIETWTVFVIIYNGTHEEIELQHPFREIYIPLIMKWIFVLTIGVAGVLGLYYEYYNDHYKRCGNGSHAYASGCWASSSADNFSFSSQTQRTDKDLSLPQPNGGSGGNAGDEDPGDDEYPLQLEDYLKEVGLGFPCALSSKTRKTELEVKSNTCTKMFPSAKDANKHALSDYHHPCLIHSKEIKKKYHDDIGNIPLGDIRKVVFHVKDHLKNHALRTHLNVIPCLHGLYTESPCQRRFGLSADLSRHYDKGHGIKQDDAEKPESWRKSQQHLEKTQPSLFHVYLLIKDAPSTQSLNQIAVAYMDRKELIDNDDTEREFSNLYSSLQRDSPPCIPFVTPPEIIIYQADTLEIPADTLEIPAETPYFTPVEGRLHPSVAANVFSNEGYTSPESEYTPNVSEFSGLHSHSSNTMYSNAGSQSIMAKPTVSPTTLYTAGSQEPSDQISAHAGAVWLKENAADQDLEMAFEVIRTHFISASPAQRHRHMEKSKVFFEDLYPILLAKFSETNHLFEDRTRELMNQGQCDDGAADLNALKENDQYDMEDCRTDASTPFSLEKYGDNAPRNGEMLYRFVSENSQLERAALNRSGYSDQINNDMECETESTDVTMAD
ncbi:Protein of unknown function [Pyronema omphalodes CBS 100304]|uniref:Uncharacterized protein n=1 Tax=Pyronema omphalodes (strain CBS 100304) TaxID=1076935 RepID=U4L032_PYROM|nr:Protein of unknown function [Pyronema omphalodes CBS 100304]